MVEAADPVVGYLGWHGRGNLGDDAIYDAVRSQVPAARFLDMPRWPAEVIASVATGLDRKLRRSTQVVGGGTFIGRRPWRKWITRGMRLNPNSGNYAIGAGVEDPAFVGHKSGSEKGELKHWLPILSEFTTVSVRGPRSAELLSDIGFSVEVSGDPALILPRPDVVAEDGLIGVNIGFGDDLWGHDPAALVDEMSKAVSHLSAQGHRFVGVLMNRDDRRWTEQALSNVAAEIVHPADANAAASELARCSVVIASRLHAGILAALSETPTIVLEYQPKCRDFALSIDDERSLIRTDEVTGAAVIDRVGSTLADSAAIRTKTHAIVTGFRQRLKAEYATLAHELGLETV
ncbi:polysaccharide pyruvyl transferase family protein [Mycolicibacterium sp. Dal123E01]|uniref:polysaccharide pyruvyl transferase family protein n=1 Tax=Mycolicibacterium sp. Dal123E01 TaxID=3457578 RepID=UPI00403EA5E1